MKLKGKVAHTVARLFVIFEFGNCAFYISCVSNVWQRLIDLWNCTLYQQGVYELRNFSYGV